MFVKVAFLTWGLIVGGFFVGWCACALLVRRPPPPPLTDEEIEQAIEKMYPHGRE